MFAKLFNKDPAPETYLQNPKTDGNKARKLLVYVNISALSNPGVYRASSLNV